MDELKTLNREQTLEYFKERIRQIAVSYLLETIKDEDSCEARHEYDEIFHVGELAQKVFSKEERVENANDGE